ncbi:hypothetical protein [Campylobacter curvus]|uniref:Phage-Barnase-EndoU-ColicinE5/D-RelE like nuclease 3 domain-containing protein n=1 Tax=Campylobacter curvus (strain 525.92) TaxID=360105 RepID=A7H0U0_CAMC5|nr:hypothetical protein [Campylobacter curvus]EAU00349.1 hypothetical protein CCV52592_0029 [Campylobacter curvus 525.92]
MAWVDIPKGARQIQINNEWIDIPQGTTQYEIPDTAPQQSFSAPSAPKVAQDTGKQKDTSPVGLGDVIDAINPFAGAQKGIAAKDKIYDAIKKEIGGLFDYQANSGATGEELERQNLTKQLSKAQHVADDTTLVNKIFGDESRTKRINDSADALMRSWALKNGYDDYGEMNGKKVVKKGDKFIPIDEPGIMDSFSTSLNEMGVPAGAVMLLSNLPQFRGLNLAGKAVTTLGVTGVASGLGRVMDVKRAADNLGADLSAGDYLQRGVNASNDDLTLGLALANGVKLAKPTLGAAKWLKDHSITGKALDLAGQTLTDVPTANMQGAMKSARALAGDETDKFIQNAKEVGGYDIDGGNMTDLQILNPIINKAKDLSASAAKKLNLDNISNALSNTKGLDAKRKEALDIALGNPNLENRVVAALQGDKTGSGARNIIKLAQQDVDNLRQILGDEIKATDPKEVIEKYYQDTKNDFGRAIDELANFKEGQTIKLSDDVIKQMKDEFSQSINMFDRSNPKIKAVLDGFDSLKGRKLDVRDLNELRANYNNQLNEVLNSDKNSYFTKTNFIKGKQILEQAMDDLLGDEGARAYLKEHLGDYKAMKGFEKNPFFEAMTNNNSSIDNVIDNFSRANSSQGKIYDDFIKRLSPKEAEKFELALIKQAFDGSIAKTGTFDIKEILNSRDLAENLSKINFTTDKAKAIAKHIDQLSKARGNVAGILSKLDEKFIKPTVFTKGIATTAEGAAKTQWVNTARQIALKYMPIIGNDAALEYHLKEAAKNIKLGGSMDDYIKNLKNMNAPEQEIKTLENFRKDLGKALFNEDTLKNIIKNKEKIVVGDVDKVTAQKMGFKYPNVKRTIYPDEIIHTIKQHGDENKEGLRGQKSINLKDIAGYLDIVNNADKQVVSQTKQGLKALISGKQINGHYVVVEEAQTKHNNLAFKTMYFRNGKLKDDKLFKPAADAKNSESLAFSSYEDAAQRVPQANKSIIPQNTKNSNDLEAELTDLEKEFIRLFPQNKNPLLKTKKVKKLKSEFYDDKTTLARKMQILWELNKLKTK